jgi:hypothetical protein
MRPGGMGTVTIDAGLFWKPALASSLLEKERYYDQAGQYPCPELKIK